MRRVNTRIVAATNPPVRALVACSRLVETLARGAPGALLASGTVAALWERLDDPLGAHGRVAAVRRRHR